MVSPSRFIIIPFLVTESQGALTFVNARLRGSPLLRRLTPAPRVQGVAQAVPDKVHREDREGDGDAGEDDGVLALDEDAVAGAEGVGKHRAPFGRGGLSTEAQEREGCDVQDGGR